MKTILVRSHPLYTATDFSTGHSDAVKLRNGCLMISMPTTMPLAG